MTDIKLLLLRCNTQKLTLHKQMTNRIIRIR